MDTERVCPDFHGAVELIGRRWSGAIVFALSQGPMRFAELGCCIEGISDRLLSARLRELEENGLVHREVKDLPVRVTYSLTPKGMALQPALLDLQAWAKEWNGEGAERPFEPAATGN